MSARKINAPGPEQQELKRLLMGASDKEYLAFATKYGFLDSRHKLNTPSPSALVQFAPADIGMLYAALIFGMCSKRHRQHFRSLSPGDLADALKKQRHDELSMIVFWCRRDGEAEQQFRRQFCVVADKLTGGAALTYPAFAPIITSFPGSPDLDEMPTRIAA